MTESISAAQARRIALAAQGFGRGRPAEVGTRALNSLFGRLQLLQIDSVNVFERSHYLPVYTRLGAFDKASLDRLTYSAKAPYLEYWAHQAAFIPREDWPLFRFRMAEFRRQHGEAAGGWVSKNRELLDWLRAELAAKGPLAASEIEHEANTRTGPWWGWSGVKEGLEFLLFFGEVVTAGRTRFQRRYALAEQVLSPELLDRTIAQEDAVRELVRRSARAHGVGTLGDLADYYRLKKAPTLAAVHDLEDSGELVPVTVRGWNRNGRPLTAWMHSAARVPRKIEATAILSPFDPVVWYRDRGLRVFDFHYRIEVYTPAPKRVYGYYVMPVLIDDRVVGRVDLKSDRQAGVLRVQAAWSEPDAPVETAARLAALLVETAAWQGLDRVEVIPRGNLAGGLAAELGSLGST